MNKVVFTVVGLNVEKLAQNLIKKGICPISIQRITAKEFTISMPFKYKDESIDYLRKKCYNIKNIEIKGFGKIKAFIVQNVAISLALVLCLVALLSLPQFYLQLKTFGVASHNQVQTTLEENGVKYGKFMALVDAKEMEAILCRQLDLAYCFIEKKGCTLCIETVAKTEQKPAIDFTKTHDVVATFDGEITKMVVLQGTPQVAVGDKVVAGQTLVLGKTTFFDGTTQDVYAIATIWAKVCVEVFYPYQRQTTTLVRTGEIFVCNRLSIGKLILEKECPFSSYEVESQMVTTSPFFIKIERLTYFCTQEKVVLPTKEQYQQQAELSALQQAVSLLGCNPQSVNYIYNQDGVSVLAYAEIKITTEN